MSQKTKSRLRYDRIILIIAMLILIIYAGIQLFGKDTEDDGTSDIEIEEFQPVVYLSPSNQTNNIFAAGDTNEAGIMRRISERVQKNLEENGVVVYVSGVDASLQEKVDFSNENEITAHVAIHSNTGSDSIGKEGALCFYDPNTNGSRELAECVYNKVSQLTPAEDRGVVNGAEGSSYTYEIAEVKAPDCLIEVEFHNNIGGANWIIENTDELGKAIADGITDYIKYAEKQYYQQYTESGETENGKQN